MENATTAMGHLNTPAAASTVVADYIAPIARGGAGTVGGAGMVRYSTQPPPPTTTSGVQLA